MKGNKVAVRYARSLFSIATNPAEVEKIKMDVDFIINTCKDRSLRAMLNSPVIRTDKKKAILKQVFEGAVSNNTLLYLAMISENHREGALLEICDSFIDLYNSSKGILNVYVNSAITIDNTERNKLREMVKTATKSNEILLNETVDSSLIGGFVLRYGDIQVDTSIRTQLEKVKQQITQKSF